MTDELLFKNTKKDSDKSETQNTSIHIRIGKTWDANALFDLINDLMSDGNYYLSNTLPYTSKYQEEYLSRSGKDNILLVSEDATGLTGWINLQRSHAKFSAHIGTIIMGVRKDRQYRGIGTLLLKQIEPLAKFMKIEKLELAVRSSNTSGYSFYFKNGFREEGKKIRSVKNGYVYDDEILMAKVIRA